MTHEYCHRKTVLAKLMAEKLIFQFSVVISRLVYPSLVSTIRNISGGSLPISWSEISGGVEPTPDKAVC